MTDIFDLFNEVLDDKGFEEYHPHYRIYFADTGMPCLCKHCHQNDWVFTGTVFECLHPELTLKLAIPINVLDSVPLNLVGRVDESL